MAEAKYFPVTLHARGDRQGSLGDPKPDMPSSEEPSLMRGDTINANETKTQSCIHLFIWLLIAAGHTSDIYLYGSLWECVSKLVYLYIS